MVTLDQLQTSIVVVIIEDDEKSTEIASLMLPDSGEDLDQVVI